MSSSHNSKRPRKRSDNDEDEEREQQDMERDVGRFLQENARFCQVVLDNPAILTQPKFRSLRQLMLDAVGNTRSFFLLDGSTKPLAAANGKHQERPNLQSASASLSTAAPKSPSAGPKRHGSCRKRSNEAVGALFMPASPASHTKNPATKSSLTKFSTKDDDETVTDVKATPPANPDKRPPSCHGRKVMDVPLAPLTVTNKKSIQDSLWDAWCGKRSEEAVEAQAVGKALLSSPANIVVTETEKLPTKKDETDNAPANDGSSDNALTNPTHRYKRHRSRLCLSSSAQKSDPFVLGSLTNSRLACDDQSNRRPESLVIEGESDPDVEEALNPAFCGGTKLPTRGGDPCSKGSDTAIEAHGMSPGGVLTSLDQVEETVASEGPDQASFETAYSESVHEGDEISQSVSSFDASEDRSIVDDRDLFDASGIAARRVSASNSPTEFLVPGAASRSSHRTCLQDVIPHVWEFLSIRDIRNVFWEFLSIREIWNLRILSKSWQRHLEHVEYVKCRDGKAYNLPFPGYPGVLTTPTDKHQNAGLFPHQLASLRAMRRAENRRTEFGSLRGGVLGDAPGLGKSITMLALVASTAGIRPISPPQFWNAEAIEDCWKAMRHNPEAKSDILKAIKPVRFWIHQNKLPKSREFVAFERLQREVLPPFRDSQFGTLQEFERYILESLKMTVAVPRSEVELVRQNLLAVRSSLDKSSRKVFKKAQERRLQWERKLIATSATLIVVPDALLEHWCQQMQQHLQLDLFADELEQDSVGGTRGDKAATYGVVYLDGVGDLADVADGRKVLRDISLSRIDELQPWELARYVIVVTTFSRCRGEMERQWLRTNNGTRQRKKRPREEEISSDRDVDLDVSGYHVSPLLRLRWLRLVVDEGHELGTHEAANCVTHFINKIAAERRWVLSGTPTTGDVDAKNFTSTALDQLQRLLYFLRHPVYGVSPPHSQGSKKKSTPKTLWAEDVKKPFLARKASGRTQLISVLKEIMVMHRKEDIKLPKPIFHQIERDILVPAEMEELLVNQKTPLAMAAHLNEYLHSSDFQSRVDRCQAEYIVEALEKARQKRHRRHVGDEPLPDCQQQPVLDFAKHPDAIQRQGRDNRPIKAVIYSSEKNNLLSVTDQVIRLMGEDRVAEMYESPEIGEISSELARFRHGVRQCRTCPVCRREIAVARKGRASDRCSATLIEVVSLNTSPQHRFLIEPERIIRARNVPSDRLGGEPLSSYAKLTKFWRIGDLLEVDIRQHHPLLPQRKSEAEWDLMGATKCRELAAADGYQGQDWYFGSLPVIEGSTTRDESLEVKLMKWTACGRYHNSSRWYRGPKLADVEIERIKQDVPVLALHSGFSHGLDLSFVTHMFLLEPINDAALLEQVTSRAHRLGAQGPVTVETIHTFFKTKSEKLSAAVEQAKSVRQDRKKALSFIVCQFCFRQFDTLDKAREHEMTLCPRNPSNDYKEDDFDLLSVYREIRPPLPALTSA